jgi:hypothetical protein
MARTPFIAAIIACVVIGLAAPPAAAHAFGQRYDLPLPLWLYTYGAGATVALSFLVIAVFFRQGRTDPQQGPVHSDEAAGLHLRCHPRLALPAEAISVALFGLILAACFLGNPDPFANFAPTFVWVVWWVGLAFFSALVGNLWDLLNPWHILFRWSTRLFGIRGTPHPYPARLGYWPPAILFLCFAWLELISEAAERPFFLGMLILAYSAATWAGMLWFGPRAWLRHGEVFSVVFGVLARFAPLNGRDGTVRLRFPAAGLQVTEPVPLSYVAFVVLLLTSVTFDGILETPQWKLVIGWISESMTLRETLLFLQDAGVDLLAAIKTVALLAMPVAFIGVYLLTCRLIGMAGGSIGIGLSQLAGWFVLSLVPIAIAYHLSHYLSYLLIAGQNIIPLASDPFGLGWDLFGTSSYRMDLGVVSAKMVWYVAVTAIVVGHVIAVFLAHKVALRVFPTNRQALFSQGPMLVLMVGYTMVSLWILSQPIVE